MKKTYLEPAMKTVLIKQSSICVSSIQSNVGITGGNCSSTESARVKERGDYNVWDDNWSE